MPASEILASIKTIVEGEDVKEDTKSQFEPGYAPPVQQQPYPGIEKHMDPVPVYSKLPFFDCHTGHVSYQLYKAAGKLAGKSAIITGGDSGIGRAVAVLFAMEGMTDIVISYLPEELEDARETKRIVEGYGTRCHLWQGDLSGRGGEMCSKLVQFAVQRFGENGHIGREWQKGKVDCLVNNAAYQMACESIEELSAEQWDRTFRTNIYSYFFMSKHCLPHMPPGSTIINNSSMNHYIGKPNFLDFTSTKGAIIAFTRALSNQLLQAGKQIRVNAVCPGPIWTPLVISTMPKKDLEKLGSTPMGRPGQPSEVATCFVFFASTDSSFISGSTLHPNGGTPIGA